MADTGKRSHWFDRLVDMLEEKLSRRGKARLVFNGGLSVSGLQHIGRLRGEVVLVEALRRELEKRGFQVEQYLTLYTQDPWKGKEEQLKAFGNVEEGRKHVGKPLIDVPDPQGCHDNWVDHYWSEFGPYLREFTDGRIKVVSTSELYRGKLKEFALRMILPKRDEVRRLINKYRGRKPYGEGWIPVEPRCSCCGRIDSTEAIELLEGGRVRYRCNNCGCEGEAGLEESKLNWRIEWVGVWWSLGVDFEPYGKDHAAPGGSRDSCVELARLLGVEPPEGVWYEWVALRAPSGSEADMTSSGFVGLSPREWLEIAHPQILRFLYFLHPPHRKIVIDTREIPGYYSQYYRAERVYFGLEEAGGEEGEILSRTYELSHPEGPPEKPPSQVPYVHAAIVAQVVGRERLWSEGLERLRRAGILGYDRYSVEWAKSLLVRALNWAERYAPERLRFELPKETPESAARMIKDPERLSRAADALEAVETWTEEAIKEALIRFGEGMSPEERREFYRDFYLAVIGKPEGPRAAPLLALMSRDEAVERLRRAAVKAGMPGS